MDLIRMIKSIDRPHPEDVLRPLSTLWGEHPSLPDALPEYPRPQFVRDSYLSLNGVWQYAIRDTAAEPERPDGRILVPFSPESRLSGVEKQLQPSQYLWYYKTLPALIRPSGDARLLLHFGAVDQTAEIYVNGHYQCTHVGGYLPFTVDITDALHVFTPQGSTGNLLCVRVQDSSQTSWMSRGKQTLKRGGMYYTAQSGIWQSVWMEWVPAGYIRGIRIMPHDDLCTVSMTFETSLPCKIEVALYDEEGKVFTRAFCTTQEKPKEEYPIDLCRSGSDLKPCNIIGDGCYVAQMRLLIDRPHLWTPEDPHLYKIAVTAGEDSLRSYFALRTFTVEEDDSGTPRFHLNHKPFFLHGVLDQGYWPESLMTAPSDKALLYDITQMKLLGFNTIRKHAKIECARWYYHCDRLGVIVWQDMVSGGSTYSKPLTSYLPTLFPRVFSRIHDGSGKYRMLSRSDKEGRAQWEAEMKGTISYLMSAPCIAVWVLFNEGWGQFDANRLTGIAKELDPSRLIDQASGWFDQGGGDFRSVHNYFRKITAEQDKHGRAFVVSEYGGISCRIDSHTSVDRIYGYHRASSLAELNEAWQKLIRESIEPLKEKGLSGAIYTQLSDIEEEVNGIMTYDRKIVKLRPLPKSAL